MNVGEKQLRRTPVAYFLEWVRSQHILDQRVTQMFAFTNLTNSPICWHWNVCHHAHLIIVQTSFRRCVTEHWQTSVAIFIIGYTKLLRSITAYPYSSRRILASLQSPKKRSQANLHVSCILFFLWRGLWEQWLQNLSPDWDSRATSFRLFTFHPYF